MSSSTSQIKKRKYHKDQILACCSFCITFESSGSLTCILFSIMYLKQAFKKNKIKPLKRFLDPLTLKCSKKDPAV